MISGVFDCSYYNSLYDVIDAVCQEVYSKTLDGENYEIVPVIISEVTIKIFDVLKKYEVLLEKVDNFE